MAEPVSRQIIGFSWWWVVAGIAFWATVVGLYYRTFLTDVEKKRVEDRSEARRLRAAKVRVETIRSGMAEAILVARIGREAATAAADLAERAVDGPSARAAAEQAAVAARRSEDSAIAAVAAANALRKRWVRKLLSGDGPVTAELAETDAAQARAAADRAAQAAAAKGAPVG